MCLLSKGAVFLQELISCRTGRLDLYHIANCLSFRNKDAEIKLWINIKTGDCFALANMTLRRTYSVIPYQERY